MHRRSWVKKGYDPHLSHLEDSYSPPTRAASVTSRQHDDPGAARPTNLGPCFLRTYFHIFLSYGRMFQAVYSFQVILSNRSTYFIFLSTLSYE